MGYKIDQPVTVNPNLQNTYAWEKFLDHTKLGLCHIVKIDGDTIEIESKAAPGFRFQVKEQDIKRKLISLIVGQKTLIYGVPNRLKYLIHPGDSVTIFKVIENIDNQNNPKVLFETDYEERLWALNSDFDKDEAAES